MSRFMSQGSRGGSTGQAAIPQFSGQGGHYNRMNGRVLQGVVIAVYVADEKFLPDEISAQQLAVFCDVLIYSTMEGFHGGVLQGVVVGNGNGMHAGHIWKPRAAKIDTSGKSLNLAGSDPLDLDGDHVLVQFIDDDLAKGVITARLPHPRVGLGNESQGEVGHRQVLKLVDGTPDLFKHNGTFYGVGKNGDFIVNTTRAHSGEYTPDGVEVPENDPQFGNVFVSINNAARLRVQGLASDQSDTTFVIEARDGKITIALEDAGTRVILEDGTVKVQIGGGDSVLLTDSGADAEMKVGTGAKSVAIAETLRSFYNLVKAELDTMKAVLNNHSHTVPSAGLFDSLAVSVTGAANSNATSPGYTGTIPSWDDQIESDRIKIPAN